jgi:type VI protein secretion system component VasF
MTTMAINGIERLLAAIDPFYRADTISRVECAEYMTQLRDALAYYGVALYRDNHRNKRISGENNHVLLTQTVQNGASKLELARNDRWKAYGLQLTCFTEYDKEAGTYIPMLLEVRRRDPARKEDVSVAHSSKW